MPQFVQSLGSLIMPSRPQLIMAKQRSNRDRVINRIRLTTLATNDHNKSMEHDIYIYIHICICH
jgi:hypothetical protein